MVLAYGSNLLQLKLGKLHLILFVSFCRILWTECKKWKFGTLGMEPLQGAWPQSRASYIQTLFNSNSTPVQSTLLFSAWEHINRIFWEAFQKRINNFRREALNLGSYSIQRVTSNLARASTPNNIRVVHVTCNYLDLPKKISACKFYIHAKKHLRYM